MTEPTLGQSGITDQMVERAAAMTPPEIQDLGSAERYVVLTTDDATRAWNELQRRRATGERGWDMAVVQWMHNPPRTPYRYCVYREMP